MEVAQAIKERYSVRAFREDKVANEKLKRLLDAARLAPSASNRQEWRFVVVRDARTRRQLGAAACDQSFVSQAPVILVCCADTDGHVMACGERCYPIDVAIAVDHMTLVATELGLGTCWIGAFDAGRVKQILGIPDKIRVVQLLLVGYSADTPRARKRLPLEEIVRYEHW